MGRCQHSAVTHGVEAGSRYRSCEPTQQRQRVEVNRECAVRKRALEAQTAQAVVEQLQALLCERWSQHIAQQRFLGRAGRRGMPHRGGVQRERRSSRRTSRVRTVASKLGHVDGGEPWAACVGCETAVILVRSMDGTLRRVHKARASLSLLQYHKYPESVNYGDMDVVA